ncbi:MAG: exo-alpha-sialidase [Candidatus Omnitrophica bacterium]|nr:exo-alpha-sialidase [Candidatus Omnitrophota bacterium]MDD5436375.1 exo-alpha-sialidase [Candidatus Omnitrophota bacterium]
MSKKIFAAIGLMLFLSAPAFAEAESLPKKELIFAPGLITSPHAPSIAEMPDGELFVVWHASWFPKAVIMGSRKPAGSDKWTLPSVVNRTRKYGNKNPVLYLNKDKRLFLFWTEEKRLIFKVIRDKIRMKTSSDFGRTWDEPRDAGKLTWFLTRTHPVDLDDGRVILPIYTDLSTSSAAAISKDGGFTWSGPKYLLFLFGIQPTIIQRSDSTLFALMRTGMWPRLAWQAISYNRGQSWKDRRWSNIQNPGFSLEMIKLKSGNVALAFNDSKTDRSSLSLALSCDEGRTWPYVRTIECKARHVYGYPSIIQDKRGLIHVVYSYDNRTSIAHFVTDEEWIKG